MTQSPPDTPTAEEVFLQGLIRRWAVLAQRAIETKQEMDVIKEHFRKLGQGAHDLGIGKVTISANTRFDPEVADTVLRAIHPDLVAKCSISKIDSTLTKKWVSGEVYARCQRSAGEDKVTVA